MIRVNNISNLLEEKFPLELAESWDNVGLLLGNKENEVDKILICLDITDNVVNKAIEEGVNLIISHHPLIFSSLKKILKDELIGNRILKLIKNNISVYSLHTNLDSSEKGLNEYILNKIFLIGNIYYEKLEAIRYINLERDYSLEEIVRLAKDNLSLNNIRLVKANDKKIRKVAITTGDGNSFVYSMINKVDLFITGDLKHHVSLDAKEMGLNLIDLTHFGSEKLCVDLIEEVLKKEFNDIKILKFNDSEVFNIL